MSNIEKAYKNGYRMGVYVVEREGIESAIEHGSLANYRYRMPSMVKAYNQGYNDAVNENR